MCTVLYLTTAQNVYRVIPYTAQNMYRVIT